MTLLHAMVLASGLAWSAHAADFEGKSSFDVRSKSDSGIVDVKSVNTTYELADPLLEDGIPGVESKLNHLGIVVEARRELQYQTGSEKGTTKLTLTGYEAASKKKLWSVDETAEKHALLSSYFIFTTTVEGCCGGEDALRAYSLRDGTKLFSFSLANRFKMPLVLRAGAFDPAKFRFLGYLDNYWPARDTTSNNAGSGSDKLALAGVLTYASPSRAIQRIGVYYDTKVDSDPSQEPQAVVVSYKKRHWDFTADGKLDEVEYWDEAIKKLQDPVKIFDGLAITLKFSDDDTIEIPLVKDRLDVARARIKGKNYVKVKELK